MFFKVMLSNHDPIMYKKILSGLLVAGLTTISAQAATYYSRTSGGNWTDNTTWSTVGYGNSTNSGTYPKSGDNAYIGDGYTIVINAACTTSYAYIGQGSSGILEYSDAGNYSLVVINNITIYAGATFRYAGNNSRTHTLSVGNNLSNSGTLDLYSDANDVVNLTFYRAANSVVSGNGTYDLNTVTVQKTTATTFTVEVQSTAFEGGIRDLVLTYGTYYHNNSSTYNVNSGSSSPFTIPADGVFKVSSGTVHLSPSSADCILNGTITLTGGTMRIGQSDGTGGLKYEKPGSFNPRLDIQSGELEVYGGLTYKTGASGSPLVFSNSGGTLKLNTGSTGTATSVFNINDVSGSSCTITDGYVILSNPNTTGSSVSDAMLCGTNGSVSVSSGILEFGDENTADGAVFSFTPVTNMTWPNIYVTGPAGYAISLKPSASNTADIKAISLHIDPDKVFDVRSISGTTGDSRTLTLTGNFDGINSVLCDGTFYGRSGSLNLQGGEGQQISGTGTMVVNNLEVDNASGSSLGMNLTIDGTLLLSDGIFFTGSSSVLTIAETGTISGATSTSYIDGPLIKRLASSGVQSVTFPIGKNGAYRPVTLNVNHSSSSSVDYQAEINASNPRDLNYDLPGTVDRISGVRYLQIDRTGAANLVSATVTMNYDADDGVTDPSNLRLLQFDGSTAWAEIGGTGTASGTGSITSGSFSTFQSLYVMGNANGGGNPLPVSWLNFTVEQESGMALLNWATASEKNSDYFEVERSGDGVRFLSLGRVGAAGNSNEIMKYAFIDQTPLNTVSYYRIRQVDRDGSISFSVVRVLQPETIQQEMNFYPNPSAGRTVRIVTSREWTPPVKIQVIDLQGKEIQSTEWKDASAVYLIDPDGIPQGTAAFVRISDEKGHQQMGKLQF